MATPNRTYGVKLVRGPVVRLPPHPLACETEDELEALIPSLSGPTAADLFCGAGGLSLGLEEAGFHVVLGVDHDSDALETHRSLCPGLSVDWDLGDDAVVDRTAELLRRTGVDLIVGGPPCQPFSKAGRSLIRQLVRTGKRPAHDHRRDLWQSFLEIVARAQPQGVLMENVPDMALDRDMMILRTMVDELENLGYSVEERVIETWRFGVPQFRSRLILVALKEGIAFQWPEESPDQVTLWNAIGDLPEVEGGWRPDGGEHGWSDYAGPASSFQQRARHHVEEADAEKVFDHITRPVRADDAEAFAGMSASTKYADLDPKHKRYREDIFTDKYKRLDENELCRTITAHIAKDGYWYIHPRQERTLTIREAARVQTFGDHVRFAGPPSSAFRQIGNAVPPLLGEKLGTAIRRSWERRGRPRTTTQFVSEELSDWFSDRAPVAVPWLAAETRWQVIQADTLLSRARFESIQSLWPVIRSWKHPADTLLHEAELRDLAQWIDRRDRGDRILVAARWFDTDPSALETLDGIISAPSLSKAVADLALRVVPDEIEDPVIATGGVLRLAARFSGTTVDQTNKGTDGRLAVARMIGVDPISDGAHLALLELAGGFCRPRRPVCSECPLKPWCAHAAGNLEPSML